MVSFAQVIDKDLPPEKQLWYPPQDFPRDLLMELPLDEEEEKEINLILGTPYEYFKIRVKHFEKY